MIVPTEKKNFLLNSHQTGKRVVVCYEFFKPDEEERNRVSEWLWRRDIIKGVWKDTELPPVKLNYLTQQLLIFKLYSIPSNRIFSFIVNIFIFNLFIILKIYFLFFSILEFISQ